MDSTYLSASILFAAVMLVLGGLLGIIEATLAWSKANYFETGAVLPVTGDLSNWAWILFILGVVQFAAAFGVAQGQRWGRWFGIFAAGATAIGQLLFLPERPEWGLVAIAFSVLVIWSLTRIDEPRAVTPRG
jgi:hypothetical protein